MITDGPPTLVEPSRRHLTEQRQLRCGKSLRRSEAHPERGIKTKVVRVTLEKFVAKGQAQVRQAGLFRLHRPEAPEPTAARPAETQSKGASLK
ncbi:hypothetical protein ACIF85_47275 [Streptomyces sp. NPDC086033]|uniref:hypothetical protein n=1 Tax=Streptomyces TaxID=1883 RepID=UPI003245D329